MSIIGPFLHEHNQTPPTMSGFVNYLCSFNFINSSMTPIEEVERKRSIIGFDTQQALVQIYFSS